MSEKEEENIKLFVQHLTKDIEILNEGLQKDSTILYYYGKDDFHIDYELFRELVKKYCYKDNMKKKRVPVSSFGKKRGSRMDRNRIC